MMIMSHEYDFRIAKAGEIKQGQQTLALALALISCALAVKFIMKELKFSTERTLFELYTIAKSLACSVPMSLRILLLGISID